MITRELVGRPVIAANTGERAGRVADVLLDAECRHAVALLVSQGLFTRHRVLPYRDIQTIGVDVVVARTLANMRVARDWIQDGLPASRIAAIKGKSMVTADGARLGRIRDLVADAATGDVVAIAIEAYGSGRDAVVSVDSDMSFAHDVVVVPSNVAGTLRVD